MIKVLQSSSPHKVMTTMYWRRSKTLLYLTAGAALATGSQAWVVPSLSTRALHSRASPLRPPADLLAHDRGNLVLGGLQVTRLYSSGKSDSDSKGFFSKIKRVAKKVLPTRIFGSEEEKQQLVRRNEVKNQLAGGLNEVLKDAPLGVRMIGKMLGPLVSGMASSLAETVAEQQRANAGVMDDARGYLMGDPAVSSLLGEPISLGAPFSQSSSTTSINGRTQTRVEFGMPVSGSITQGTVRVIASQDGIAQMQLEAAGRRIDISLTNTRFSGGAGSSRPIRSSPINGDDNIIEAEIIDKETK